MIYRLSLLGVLLVSISSCAHNKGHECPVVRGPAGQELLVRCLEDELKTSKQIEQELAELVEAIRSSRDAEADLIASLGARLDKPDALISLLRAIDTVIDVRLKNMRNARTPGYKKIEVVIVGGRPIMTRRIFTQGSLKQTANPLDLAIEGPGFFQVSLPDGSTAYTRCGHFVKGPNGELMTMRGNYLHPEVNLPDEYIALSIAEDGAVNITTADGTQSITGVIELAKFSSPELMGPIDEILLQETRASGWPVTSTPGEDGMGRLRAGHVENSNVYVPEELHALRTLQRWKESIEEAITMLNRNFER
jgi:flagellar basal body rod protein FlgG